MSPSPCPLLLTNHHFNAIIKHKSILEVNVRKKYGISIVLIKSGENIIDPLPNTVFEKGDTLFVLGSTKNIDNVEKKIAEAVDFENRFADAATE